MPLIMFFYTKFAKITALILLGVLIFGNVLSFNLLFAGNYRLGYEYLADTNIAKDYGISPFPRIDSYLFGILLAFAYE